jgi:hypothetical protein
VTSGAEAAAGTARSSESLAADSADLAGRNPEPTTHRMVERLRCKLDAAIDDEAWEAVKVIRERILEIQREQARNVVALDEARARRRG